MVRPDRVASPGDSCCIELAGESPVAVSAGAPRSRPRTSGETSPSEWGVKSPRRVVGRAGGEQVRRPSTKRTLQPREIGIRKETGWPSRSCHGEGNRLHLQPDGCRTPAGYRGGHADSSSMRTRRGPSRRPASGEGAAYKLKAKGRRAGRESEGFVVPKGRPCLPVKPAKAGGGKGPCFGDGRVRR